MERGQYREQERENSRQISTRTADGMPGAARPGTRLRFVPKAYPRGGVLRLSPLIYQTNPIFKPRDNPAARYECRVPLRWMSCVTKQLSCVGLSRMPGFSSVRRMSVSPDSQCSRMASVPNS